ncbi:MAG: CocE/NonD family hydrolase, partial [Candidatus Geothermincolales bacterium]
MAVFLFDYRNFGSSEGEPRYLINPWRHLADWEAALAYVRGLDGVDGSRVGLWGTSYSGGHVLVTAARDKKIGAAVVQVPFVNGPSSVWRTGLRHAWRASLEALKDVGTILLAREPHYVPIVAEPHEFGILNTPECWPGYMSLVPEGSAWQNRCPARAAFQLLFYAPSLYTREVRCPTLVVIGVRDSLISPRAVERAVSRIREVSILHLDAGHFDVYRGDLFLDVSERQADFLARHLGAG